MSNLEDLARASGASNSLQALFEAAVEEANRSRRCRKIPKGATRTKTRRITAAAKQARRINRTNKRGRKLASEGGRCGTR